MFNISQNTAIEYELSRLKPVNLDALSEIKLMNRVELKYVFETKKLTDLINLLGAQYHVLEVNNRRILPYSTTYLDTADSLFFYQHVRGILARHKVRYRRYLATDESFLEIKKKTKKGRTVKWRIENEPMSLAFDPLALGFIEKYLPVSSTLVKPSLKNEFTRITLASFEMRERITLDFNISFSDPENKEDISLPYLAVVELKKDVCSEGSHFNCLMKQLNIYPTGFSKYCVGRALLSDTLKINMIKPKLLLLNKLENEYK